MSILEPIIKIVGRLSFSNKLRATAVMFGVPLLVAAGVMFQGLNGRVMEVRQERAALGVQVPALRLLADLHQYSAVRVAIDAGAAELEALADAKRGAARNSLLALKAAAAENKLLAKPQAGAQSWLGRWDALAQQIDAADASGLSQLASALRGELDKLNENSGLLLDGHASTSRLLDIMTTHVPGLVETTGRAANIGTVVLVKQSIRGSRRSELTVQRGNFDALVLWSMEGLQKVAKEHPEQAAAMDEAASGLNTAFLAVQEAITIKMLDTSDFGMTPEAFVGLTGKALTDTLSIGAIVSGQADQMLGARLDTLEFQRNSIVAMMVIALALLITGFIGAYVSIMRGLDGLSNAVDTMASGDLDARAEIHTRDEIGKLAVQFNAMAENLATRTLELRDKTNHIHGMLQNMPQGVLTIIEGGTIHAEHSAYLSTIFETDRMAGMPALDFVFGDSDVGSDALAQVQAAVAACLGEDRMNFAFNAHLLVGEIHKRMADGRSKILELGWSPICDEQDVVEKIMICVRDVTELRQLEAEARHQKLELEMIGQILNVSQEKFNEFIGSTQDFLAANELLLLEAADGQPEPGLVAELFRNMHTIKGNARTYGLLHLTNVVHEAEQAYDELRKNPERSFDLAALLAQLDVVKQNVAEYATLNEAKLGRKGPGRRGSAEKYVMVERVRVEQLLSVIEAYDLKAARPETLAALLQQVKVDLRLIGTEPVRHVLDGVFASLPSLARELGKEPPELLVEDAGIFIRNQITDLLRNLFMHLYRNSMDHGIEAAAERMAAGKPAVGTIRLHLDLQDDTLLLRLSDDGRGLALAHIRAKAVARGLIEPSAMIADEDLAKLIFAAGFSTATTVTEVSGRGVGMDAVQNFIKREGGSIRLVLTDDQRGADFRTFETVIALPGKFAVAVATDRPLALAESRRGHETPTEHGGFFDAVAAYPGKLAATEAW